MNESAFISVYRELIEENPFAVRAVLKILEIEFSDAAETLAVTCEERPRLLVNLGFVTEHCKTDAHLKAVICHEFLHVLLRHTERFDHLAPAEHIALDAVINAIIHRELGPEYSGMMSQFYARETGVTRILRAFGEADKEALHGHRRSQHGTASRREFQFLFHWSKLYLGHYTADDIFGLVKDLTQPDGQEPVPLLGGHCGSGSPGGGSFPEITGVLRAAVERSLRSMNGSGIWRSPRAHGVGADAYAEVFQSADVGVERWKRETFAVLKRLLRPDPKAKRSERRPCEYSLPVLSSGDRRAALRSLWSPFLPESRWEGTHRDRGGSAHVYLDVSGSMDAEMPLVIALLQRLQGHIHRPLFAFSDEVAPARIVKGKLLAETSGGTSMSCVLEHLAATRPPSALVVTDGYIERVREELVARAGATQLHALVTRDGSSAELAAAGIPYTQLGRLPQ